MHPMASHSPGCHFFQRCAAVAFLQYAPIFIKNGRLFWVLAGIQRKPIYFLVEYSKSAISHCEIQLTSRNFAMELFFPQISI